MFNIYNYINIIYIKASCSQADLDCRPHLRKASKACLWPYLSTEFGDTCLSRQTFSRALCTQVHENLTSSYGMTAFRTGGVHALFWRLILCGSLRHWDWKVFTSWWIPTLDCVNTWGRNAPLHRTRQNQAPNLMTHCTEYCFCTPQPSLLIEQAQYALSLCPSAYLR